MTPAARIQVAADILDRVADGEAVEQALTRWARNARFAGSKDRAAIRDHVFDALRMWRSTAAAGGGDSGRARMIGLLRLQDQDPSALFTGEGYAPEPLSAEEAETQDPSPDDLRDLPDWLWPVFTESLGEDAPRVAEALRHRAPVSLRVNTLKSDRATVATELADEGIETRHNPRADTALTVLSNPRRVAQSQAYQSGKVELQDAASQAAVADLPLAPGMRVLDYCAGGGGKALAMAARLGTRVEAHDAAPARMRDLPARAARADADIAITARPDGPYDLILCDVPCSGAGTWRRAPEAKWRLTPERLSDLAETQRTIMDAAAALLAPNGTLAYATCSVLAPENEAQVDTFLKRHKGFRRALQWRMLPDTDGDGFFFALLTRA
ncbi:Ribosomal RNA small subunit methyltransferase B [Roseivivax sp. THAF40]|uniref:RsmB/NOP family class I SAM-dependent RNA methyltransferase n=1 Tax=Roseivivax sp. THAF40 TaxID=2587858 RepID=UPI0012688C28|nr:RsmB/NOP family class I SAM-dependent RNA methyltransferase [Roseivivax sp. THAF40]QFT47122.1 Ribosomal RNA small subunit methyltransferase B [Roseivivax sp. THAF40]